MRRAAVTVGIDLTVAESVEDARQKLNGVEVFDVAVLDTGDELLPVLDGRKIPVLFYSALNNPAGAELSRRAVFAKAETTQVEILAEAVYAHEAQELNSFHNTILDFDVEMKKETDAIMQILEG